MTNYWSFPQIQQGISQRDWRGEEEREKAQRKWKRERGFPVLLPWIGNIFLWNIPSSELAWPLTKRLRVPYSSPSPCLYFFCAPLCPSGLMSVMSEVCVWVKKKPREIFFFVPLRTSDGWISVRNGSGLQSQWPAQDVSCLQQGH